MRMCECGKEVEEERVELLDSTICSECAKKGIGQESIQKAATIYNEDGTMDIQLMDAKDFDRFQSMVKSRDSMHSCA